MGEDAQWLWRLWAGDLFNLGPLSIKQSACVTAVVDHIYPASKSVTGEAAYSWLLVVFLTVLLPLKPMTVT